jgi:hypothetical protein
MITWELEGEGIRERKRIRERKSIRKRNKGDVYDQSSLYVCMEIS